MKESPDHTKKVTTTILGVVVEADDEDSAKNLSVLRGTFQGALQRTLNLLHADFTRSAIYEVHSITSLCDGAKSVRRYSGISLFDDCGLPLVTNFGRFLSTFLSTELSVDTLPFCAVQQNTTTHIWLGSGLPRRWWRESYFSQAFNLARLNRTDHVWSGAPQQAWYDAFANSLRAYLTSLFSGGFLDRNGVKLAFDFSLGLDKLSRLDQIQISPQVAGEIVAALVEFLGDRVFQVRYYAPAILAQNRIYRGVNDANAHATAAIDIIRQAINAGALTEHDASQINIPLHGSLNWAKIGGSPMINDNLSRMILRRAEELDIDLLETGRRRVQIAEALDDVDNGKSELQSAYTCFKAEVIKEHLRCNFIPDPEPTQLGECDRDKDTGRLDGNKTDYSDLIGKLVSFGATTAQKNVRSLIGALIRGVSVLSLDNEVVAEIVSSAASTLAKKAVEKVFYEWLTAYVADKSVDPQKKRSFLAALAAMLGVISK